MPINLFQLNMTKLNLIIPHVIRAYIFGFSCCHLISFKNNCTNQIYIVSIGGKNYLQFII